MWRGWFVGYQYELWRGRGGSAGQAGSKSAVLFQVIDLLDWLDGREAHLERDIHELEMLLGVAQRPHFG